MGELWLKRDVSRRLAIFLNRAWTARERGKRCDIARARRRASARGRTRDSSIDERLPRTARDVYATVKDSRAVRKSRS